MRPETMIVDLASKAGQTWEFAPEGQDFGPIAVPEGGWRKQGHKCDAGAYRLNLQIPKSAAGNSVQLYFEAINFGAQIYIGKDESSLTLVTKQINPWMPVTADITPFVKAGETYVLLIKVKGRNKFQHERMFMNWDWQVRQFRPSKGKHWMVPQAASWLDGIAEGIIRGARMLILPAVHLSEPYIVTSIAQGTMNPYVKVNNSTCHPIKGVIRQKLSSADDRKWDYPALTEIPFTLDAEDSRRFDLLGAVWGLGRESYWWPNVPYQKGYRAVLHNLTLEVVVDGKVVHTLTQRFGFREFTWKGCYYYLNGVRCNLRGDNQQEADFGTDAYGTHPGFGQPSKGSAGWPGAVDTLQRMNFNVLRIHQVPPTQYMLDVCDELGLMIVDETPVRNSEGLEDWVGGWDNMIAVARAMALRDRNHPSIIIWSAANEIWNNRPLSLALQGAIWGVDWTRPIIIDGIEEVGPEIINMRHYVSGLGNFPETGGEKRADRPYGETEDIWPRDNEMLGFAWMATSTRWRRFEGNADIRNYVLNNAFPNYVPGHGRDQQLLEKKVKNYHCGDSMEILPDIQNPWKHPNILLIQKCYNPCTACDLEFDRENRHSNEKGQWPVKKLALPANATTQRTIAVFNDTFAGDELEFTWQAKSGSKKLGGAKLTLRVPNGEFVKFPVLFPTPASGEVQLTLKVAKSGQTLFEENAIVFEVK